MDIKKASRIVGKSLAFRDASTADAEFIYSLRSDKEKSRHLSTVGEGVSSQVQWLEMYAARTSEAYFIIEAVDASNGPLGTVRLYDAQGDSFCWGSWVLSKGAPGNAAIESALMVYAYALEHLGFKNAHFQVHRENESVWKFHERFGATRSSEDDVQFHYALAHDDIVASMARYRRFLNNGITIQEIPN
jgi:RimJ/RimL family protein N-acetyltransferase